MIDKAKLIRIEADMNAAIRQVAEKHGLRFDRVDLRRSREGSFCRLMKLDFYETDSVVGKAAALMGYAAGGETLEAKMKQYGIKKTRNKKGDVLTAFNPRSPKYCFSYRSAGGTDWKITPMQAAKRFA